MAAYVPDAGDIIKIDLDPRTGHEQGGWRPDTRALPRLCNETGLAVVGSYYQPGEGLPV